MENKTENPANMDNFAKFIGAKITKADPGFAVAELEIEDRHKNGIGIVQGGVTYTLADFAFAAASNASGRKTVGVQSNITYFRPPKGALLRAEAREVSSTKRLCNYCVDVYDELGTYVARLCAMGFVRD